MSRCQSTLTVYQMGTYLIYHPSLIPVTLTGVQVQETRLALLPLRSVLLRHRPQLHLYLVPTTKPCPFCSMLLSLTWVTRQRCHHMAE